MAYDVLILAVSASQILAGMACLFAGLAAADRQRGIGLAFAVVLLASGTLSALVGAAPRWSEAGAGHGVAVTTVAGLVLLACALLVAAAGRAALSRSDSGEGSLRRRYEACRRAIAGFARARRAERNRADAAQQIRELFETAARMSNTTIAFQDLELRYRWIVNSNFEADDAAVAMLDDSQLIDEPQATILTEHKRRALETGHVESFELEHPRVGESNWYRYSVSPVDKDGEAVGVITTAIDITRSKRLDKMRTDLSKRLAETLQRFDLALKSSNILVFSQDTDLRYVWVNSTQGPIKVAHGKTDADLFPEATAAPLIAIKRKVIAERQPATGEFAIGEGEEQRWYDLHVEPNLSAEGEVTGLTCAAVDITHRVRNEQQMRLVMRELTHRTKNLLAVAIAIARQTAFRATSVDAFVQALSARLRALATAQDLIVADDWAGVDLENLIRNQIEQLMPQRDRVMMSGPQVVLSPEATQNFGLVLHELAANAARYGALSSADGKVRICWDVDGAGGEPVLRLEWTEEGGPAVNPPSDRGFGLNVIERNLARSLKAEIEIKFEEPGFAMSLALPMKHITSGTASDPSSKSAEAERPQPAGPRP